MRKQKTEIMFRRGVEVKATLEMAALVKLSQL